jgi:thiamine transporter ThiT
MFNIPLLAMRVPEIWYALPLVVAVSLVYAATRHELMGPILVHAARLGIWIGAIMGLVFGVLFWIARGL